MAVVRLTRFSADPAETDTPPAVEAVGLVKTFGTARAIDGVDLVVPTGGVYGFLGPNGAGKTTTIRVLATLLRPDAGTVRVLGCRSCSSPHPRPSATSTCCHRDSAGVTVAG